MSLSQQPHARCLEPLALTDCIRLKNRLYFAPMGIDAARYDGGASEEMLSFYEGIIDGGCGMVILGNASVDPSTRLHQRGLCLHNKKHAESLRPLIAYGRARQCEVVVQLQHYGAQGSTAHAPGPLLSPSAVACPRMSRTPGYALREMTHDDIINVRDQFVMAAGWAREAGARVIQLQASNGYLLSSFLSPYTNRRTDEYGGDPCRRMRLLLEIVSDIRSAQPDLQVSVRLGMDDLLGSTGQQPHLLASQVDRLRSLGVVAVTFSVAIGETFHKFMTPSIEVEGALLDGLRQMRRSTSLPIGYSGFIPDLDAAEKLLETLNLDLIGMTRALFADNDLITKTVQNKKEDIHQCRFDSNCFRDKSNPELDRVYCCVNPRYLRPSNIQYNES